VHYCKHFFWLTIAAMLPLSPAAEAQSQTNNLSIYAGGLVNGFRDASWAARSLTNASPTHSGKHSIRVNALPEWQAICFRHAGFDSSPYDRVSFWVHGGPDGGQRVQVQGLVGTDNPPENVYYRIVLPTNVWQHVTVPLDALGVENKSNFTGIWFQLMPNSPSNVFYLDDIELYAKAAPAAQAAGQTPDRLTAYVAGSLAVIIVLLGCLVFLFWRRNAGELRPTTSMTVNSPGEISRDPASAEEWRQRAPTAEAMAGKQGQMLREKIMPELTEFAKQSLVQGLYTQRNSLLETQHKAQLALAELESRLANLQLPLQERIRAYEKRIAELEKEVETQGEEMRELTRATLMLVRKKLEDERENERTRGRFN